MKHWLWICSIVVLSGCVATEKLTKQGMSVQPVTSNQKEKYCEHVSFVEGFGAPLTGGMKTAMTDARNQAGKLGANAIHVIGTRSEPYSGGSCCYNYVDAEALICNLPQK